MRIATRTFKAFAAIILGASVLLNQTVLGGSRMAPLETREDDAPSRNAIPRRAFLWEKNVGQSSDDSDFLGRGSGYLAGISGSEAKFRFRDDREIRIKFAGAKTDPEYVAEDEQITRTNVFRGSDKSNWHSQIPNFGAVLYPEIYDGIGLRWRTSDNSPEFDLIFAPNADPETIAIDFGGAESVQILPDGSLSAKTGAHELIQKAPVAFQDTEYGRRTVESRFVMRANGSVGFGLGEYDRSRELTIDPAVRYSTYIGGDTGNDRVDGITVDGDLNTIVVGTTDSTDFTPGSVPRDSSDKEAVFIAKLNSIASQYLYLTILDGRDFERATDVAVDESGNAYLTGATRSKDFPMLNAFDPTGDRCIPIGLTCLSGFHSGDAFLTKIGTDGGLLYSTYLSGHDEEIGHSVAVGPNNLVYVSGYTASLNFPKVNEYQTLGSTFLTVISTDGNSPIYSTRFDANATIDCDVAVDQAGNAYLTATSSSGTPTKNAFQPNNAGGDDVVVAKFNPFASGNASLVYSTFLGGSGTDRGKAIAVTGNGRAFVTGVTGSTNFPLLNAVDSTNVVNEAFVAALNTNGSLFASTFLGGNSSESGEAIAVDVGGVIYVAGTTKSTDFPRVLAFQNTLSGTSDAFVTKLRLGSSGTSAITGSTFYGGSGDETAKSIAVSGNKHIYVGGSTRSANLPTSGGSVKSHVVVGSSFEQGFALHLLDSRRDTIGVYSPGVTEFTLRNSIVPGGIPVITTVDFGASGEVPVMGDWNGDGIDTTGVFLNGVWRLRNFNVAIGYPLPPTTFNFGQAGDIPLAGDWDGDGFDTPGVYRPATRQFLLSNSLTDPQIDLTITFGLTGDRPVVGDWDGNGTDTPGVYRPSDGRFRLTNQLSASPAVSNTFTLGSSEDLPIAGDWNGDSFEDVGLWRPSTQTFSFDTNKADGTDLTSIVFGATGDVPLGGEWEGKP